MDGLLSLKPAGAEREDEGELEVRLLSCMPSFVVFGIHIKIRLYACKMCRTKENIAAFHVSFKCISNIHLIHFIPLQTNIYPKNNFNLIKTDFSFSFLSTVVLQNL